MAPNLHLGKIITKTAIAGRYNQAAIWGGGYLGVSECIKEDGTKAHVWARLLQRLQSLVGTTKLLYGGGYLGVSECIKEDGTKAHVWARLLQRLQSLVGTTRLLYQWGGGYLGVSECIKKDGTKLMSGQDCYKDCNCW